MPKVGSVRATDAAAGTVRPDTGREWGQRARRAATRGRRARRARAEVARRQI